jgi:Helitron helicase-like domain at N-terminus
MELQLSHLLSIDESPFASDPTFAFVYWSILQKKEVTRDCSFRLTQSQFERMTNELTQIPAQTLTELERKLQISPGYRLETPPECAALKILSQLNVMNTHLRGSSGSKVMMRNEIRSLIQRFGVPALFITLNPSDVNNPLVRLIVRENILLEDELRGEDLSKFMRQKLAAKYPNATAKFFDCMIRTFFNKIVRYGSTSFLFIIAYPSYLFVSHNACRIELFFPSSSLSFQSGT